MEENLAIPGSVEVELGEFRVIPGPKGETGERGPRGYGIESAVLNPDYTLTLKFEDGSSYTTGSIRGADGTGISSVEVVPGEDYGVEPYDTLKIGLTDGKIEEFKIYNAAATSAEAAQAARTGAETARTGAESARTGAETAQTGAEDARDGAVNARTGAESARDEAKRAAEAAAQAAAEETVDAAAELLSGYVNDAGSSAGAAQEYAGEAGTARDGAGRSATAAAGSATAAKASETAAKTAQTGAETAKDKAETAGTTAAQKAADTEKSADTAKKYSGNPPVIDETTGNWKTWNAETGAYADTGKPARGEKGERGERGAQGIEGPEGKQGPKGDAFTYEDFTTEQLEGLKGPKGDTGAQGATGAVGPAGPTGAAGKDGVSPTVELTRSGTAVTVKITDASGEHTATVNDGAKGDPGEPGTVGPAGPAGDRGEAFTYDDFTPEQLEALKGPKGEKGDDGAPGADGAPGKDGAAGPQGPAGPNTVSADTSTGFTGLLKGNGESVAQAVDGEDYLSPGKADEKYVSFGENPPDKRIDLPSDTFGTGIILPYVLANDTMLCVGITRDGNLANLTNSHGFIFVDASFYALVSALLNKQIDTPVNAISDMSMLGFKIKSLADPEADGDAVNKGYVDAKAPSKPVAYTLAAAEWADSGQAVDVPGIVADETAQIVDVAPATANFKAYMDAGIYVSAVAAGKLTFTCGTVPAEDLTVYVSIQNVG